MPRGQTDCLHEPFGLARAVSALWLAGGVVASAANAVEPAANGIPLPTDYKTWQVLAVSHRIDKTSLRAILGNDIAIRAARKGGLHPWPAGTVLAKVVWKEKTHDKWPAAIVPGELVHVEVMVKDAQRFAATGGWGFARWQGTSLTPYGKDPAFAQECFNCHTGVKEVDYVFTVPAVMP